MFTLLEVIEPNREILELLKGKAVMITKGRVYDVKNTNIRLIIPCIYQFIYENKKLYIYEYRGNFKGSKNFYISSLKKAFTLRDAKDIL